MSVCPPNTAVMISPSLLNGTMLNFAPRIVATMPETPVGPVVVIFTSPGLRRALDQVIDRLPLAFRLVTITGTPRANRMMGS